MSVYEIIGLVLGSAATVEIIRWLSMSRKTSAETSDVITKTDISLSEAYKGMVEALLEPLRKRVTELEARTIEQEREIVHLQVRLKRLSIGVRKLIDQVVTMGGSPCWEPDDDE